MPYPSTTQYLTRKLNWMARKLISINDPPTIKAWMGAMTCVFETLQALSANKGLSTPTQVTRRTLEYHKAQSISVIPIHKGDTRCKTVKNVGRLIVKGKRSSAPRSSMESNIGKVKRIGQQIKRSVRESPNAESLTEVEKVVSNLDEACQWRRTLGIRDNEIAEQIMPKCPKSHQLKMSRIGVELLGDGDENIYICDECANKTVPDGGEVVWRCNLCDFDLCHNCVTNRIIEG